MHFPRFCRQESNKECNPVELGGASTSADVAKGLWGGWQGGEPQRGIKAGHSQLLY
jgi:hypothetical protein